MTVSLNDTDRKHAPDTLPARAGNSPFEPHGWGQKGSSEPVAPNRKGSTVQVIAM